MNKSSVLPAKLADDKFTFGEFVDFQVRSNDRCYMSEFDVSLTRQEFLDECDINQIMANMEANGVISHVNRAEPMFLDWTKVPDLRGSLDAMRQASASFYSLDAKIRREFDNSPEAFVEFAQDPVNLEQMRKWGLAPLPVPEAPPVRVELVDKKVVPVVPPVEGGGKPA